MRIKAKKRDVIDSTDVQDKITMKIHIFQPDFKQENIFNLEK